MRGKLEPLNSSETAMNPSISLLQPYPFEKLAALFDGVSPAKKKPILWSIGEPKHDAPDFVFDVIKKELNGLSNYPLTAGLPELRAAIRDWLVHRFKLNATIVNAEKHVLPVNGTREALFAFCHFTIKPASDALVLMPNPFYQIYEGAAYLAGAKPWYLNLDPSSFLPDFDAVPEEVWEKCQLIYICSPGNPTGAVLNSVDMQKLIKLSDQFNFVIASDECYSEIYPDEDNPPCGLLQAAHQMGRDDFKNCVVFHSLSKRSSLPGMRSGFVAGDAELIRKFKLYRTYHGCAMSPPFQKASIAAWQDETHVVQNRALYREKFRLVHNILGEFMDVKQPAGSFYLWPHTPFADTMFAKFLYRDQNLTVLPGSYLSRDFNEVNPGVNRLRMALVAPIDECREGAERLREFMLACQSGSVH